MYLPRFIVVVFPSQQGNWKWFRKRCDIGIIDSSKLDKENNTFDLVDYYGRKKWDKELLRYKLGRNDAIVQLYNSLDYMRRGPRSRFGKTLKMAQELVDKLNKGEEVNIENYKLPDIVYEDDPVGVPF